MAGLFLFLVINQHGRINIGKHSTSQGLERNLILTLAFEDFLFNEINRKSGHLGQSFKTHFPAFFVRTLHALIYLCHS